MADQLCTYEEALRQLPLHYSLALWLRDRGVAPGVICECLDIGLPALPSLYRIAEAKLRAVQGHSGFH